MDTKPKKRPAKRLKSISHMSKINLLVFVLVFASIGSYILTHSFATSNPNLPGDLNNDNVVNAIDLSTLLSNYGTSNAAGDANSDGAVNAIDLSIVLSHYGQSVTGGTTATFGKTAIGSGWTTGLNSDDKFVEQFSVPSSGTVTKLSYYVKGDVASSQVARAVIYADNNGVPGALLGQGTEVSVPANKAAGWLDFPLSTSVSVTGSSKVWIGLIRGATQGNIDIATDFTGGNEGFAADTYSDGASNPFGALGGTSTYDISGYATYLTNGSGGGGGGGGTAGPGIGLYTLAGSIFSQTHLSSYGTIVVDNDASEAQLVCGLPSPAKPLIYFASADVNKDYNVGVDWNTANANGWLLRNAAGNLLVNQGYANNNVPDVGNPSFQQAWINNVVATTKGFGCKGVFIDDVFRDIFALAHEYPAKYPDQPSWEAAQLSFIKAVGTALKNNGLYVAANSSGYTPGDGLTDDGTLTVAFWQEIGPYLNGMMNEYYQETSEGSYTLRSNGANWNQHWDGWQRLIGTAQSMGDDFIGQVYGPITDTQKMHYSRGSFLLEWNGGNSFFSYGTETVSDYWSPGWTNSIGQPTGAKSQVASGVWMRPYTNGVVYVNTNTFAVTAGGHSLSATDAYIGP
jgi:hypothetical protein